MTIKVIIRSVLLAAVILLFSSASAQNIKTNEIATYVDSLSKGHQLSSVVVASYKGKIIYEKAIGYAEAEFNLPNQLNTRFCIASVTKSMTRVIALKLAEEGKLQLQDKLSKWVQDFPGGNQITIQMLLDHRGKNRLRASIETVLVSCLEGWITSGHLVTGLNHFHRLH